MINEEIMLAGHKFIALLAIILFCFYSGIRFEYVKHGNICMHINVMLYLERIGISVMI